MLAGMEFGREVIKVVSIVADEFLVPSDRGVIAGAVYRVLGQKLEKQFFVKLHDHLRYKPFVWQLKGIPGNDEKGAFVLRFPRIVFSTVWPEVGRAFFEGIRDGFEFNGNIYVPVQSILERWSLPIPHDTFVYAGLRVLSPVVVSSSSGYRRKRYLLYEEDPFAFAGAVARNLARKAEALAGLKVDPGCIEFAFDPLAVRSKKRHGARIFKVNGGSVMGYQLPAVIRCPAGLLPVILGAGLGERNAQGFGFVELAGLEVDSDAAAAQYAVSGCPFA